MHRLLLRCLACFLLSLSAFSARAAEPELPEPPVIRAARVVTQPRGPAPKPKRPAPWERDDTLAHLSLAIGGVGFLTASVSATLMMKKRAEIDACRGGKCTPRMREELTKYKALERATAIGTAVGVAGTCTGFALLLVRQKRSREGVYAVAGPSQVGLKARF